MHPVSVAPDSLEPLAQHTTTTRRIRIPSQARTTDPSVRSAHPFRRR